MNQTTTRPASPYEVRFMNRVGFECAELANGNPDRKVVVDLMRSSYKAAFHDSRKALRWIKRAVDVRNEWQQADNAPAPDGIHILENDIFKVKRAIYGSGQPYALILKVTTGGKVKFVKQEGAVKKLSNKTLMSVEQAQDFGRIYGVCLRCSRPLTDEDSIKRGLGQWCYDILVSESEAMIDHK